MLSLYLEKRTAHTALWSMLHLVDLAGSETYTEARMRTHAQMYTHTRIHIIHTYIYI